MVFLEAAEATPFTIGTTTVFTSNVFLLPDVTVTWDCYIHHHHSISLDLAVWQDLNWLTPSHLQMCSTLTLGFLVHTHADVPVHDAIHLVMEFPHMPTCLQKHSNCLFESILDFQTSENWHLNKIRWDFSGSHGCYNCLSLNVLKFVIAR